MAKINRVEVLEDMVLDAVEVIDNSDQSRMGLSDALDEVRSILEIGYGEGFDEDVAERLGYELEDETEDEE